jgi:hypothetical protein
MHADETTATTATLEIAGPADGFLDLAGLPAAVAPPVDAPASALDIRTLEQRLIEEGYRLGAPPHVTPRTLALDQAAACEAGCPGCGCHDGVVLAPYHKAGSFRYAASCAACFARWEG